MMATKTALALMLVSLTCLTLGEDTLTPAKFLEENEDAFSIVLTAYKRLPPGSVFQEAMDDPEAGATFIIPFDVGFAQASNRTVEDLLGEVENSSLDALQWWLGQWLIPERLETTDELLQAGSADTINGQTLLFKRVPEKPGVVVSMEGEQLGAGGLVGPAAIDMGNVVAFLMGPLDD